jgi:hypothetical protein
MATTNNFTFGVDAHPFTLNFPFIDEDNLVVTLDGVVKTLDTDYTVINKTSNTAAGVGFLSGAQIQFTASPLPTTGAVKVVRNTTLETTSTFKTGSAIRAIDLNSNFTQNLYVTEEISNNAILTDGSNAFDGNLNMGGNRITNLGTPATDSDAVTKLYVDSRVGSSSIPGYTRWRTTATASQTVFSGVGESGGTLTYSATRENVYVNGALQQRTVDYTADNGTTITFIVGLQAGDIVDVVCVNNVSTVTSDQSSELYFLQSGTGAETRTVESKLRDVVSVKDFGATGTGDDTTEIQAALTASTAVTIPNGTYTTSARLNLKDNLTIRGDGAEVSTVNINDPTVHGLYGVDVSNVTVEGVTITGIPDVRTGALFFGTDPGAAITLENLRLGNSSFYGGGLGPSDPTDLSNGWLFEATRHGFAYNLYSQDIGAFAHEFKNRTEYSVASNLIAYNSETAFGLGSTISPDGPNYNLITGVISHQCNTAMQFGLGDYNLASGVISNTTSAPSTSSRHVGVFSGTGNVLSGAISTGTVDTGSVRFNGTAANNHANFADYSANERYAWFRSGATGNTVFLQNSTTGTSIDTGSRILDQSGSSIKSTDANVVLSLRTGEWRGSSTGRFKFDLSDTDLSAATLTSADRLVLRNDGNTNIVTVTPDSNSSGYVHSTPSGVISRIQSVDSGAVPGNYLQNLVDTVGTRLYTTVFRPTVDATLDLGASLFKWVNVYAQNFRPGTGLPVGISPIWTSGTGAPNGAVTADPGSLYTDATGGAGATLWVKESGTGNTGWVAK